MTSKKCFYSSKKEKKTSNDWTLMCLSDQFNNFNLNKDCPTLSKCYFREPQSLSNYIKDSKSLSNNFTKNDFNVKKDLSLKQKSFYQSTVFEEKEIKDKKKNVSLNNSSSTLSLHIAAYENSEVDYTWIPKQQLHNGSQKQKNKWKKVQDSKVLKKAEDHTVIPRNSYEFPRQQEDNSSNPEVMMFKASQRLLDPIQNKTEVEHALQPDSSQSAYTDEYFFDIVYNGVKKNLNVVPLPEKIKVPKTKGVHILCFSVPTSDFKIKKAHVDDETPWLGKSRKKNFIIENVDGKVINAKECRIPYVKTHGQCFYVTHGNYAQQNNTVTKRVFSATTTVSQTPVANTLIVVVYSIERDLDSAGCIQSSAPSPSIPRKTPPRLPQKRPDENLTVSPVESKRNKRDPSYATKFTDKANMGTSKSSLIGFDPDAFFVNVKPPSTSPASPISSITNFPFDKMKIDKLEKQLKEAEEKLQKALLEKKEVAEKYSALYQKWYKLNEKFNNLKEKQEENQERFNADLIDLNKQLDDAKNDCFRFQEESRIQKIKDDEKIKELENAIMILREKLEEQQIPKPTVSDIKINGKYTPMAKLTMSKLVNLGVAAHTVGPVMQCVSQMFGHTLNAIPSARTVNKSPFLTQSLNQEQLRRVITEAVTRNISTTSCSDETRKSGLVWQNHILYTLDEQDQARKYCLGNVPVIDKSADVSLNALENILKDLNTEDGSNYWETFIMSLGNRMSDEAATEKLFTKKVESIRRIIISNQERYKDLTEDEKENLAKLSSFFCQLHILQNLTPIVTNVLLEHEKELRDNEKLQQPTVLLLLKTLSKHLGNRSSSKYNSNTAWKDYCEKNNVKFGKIPDFVGNRFNIVFAIAACVFYLREDIIDFIENFATDLRDTPVLAWLKDPIVISHLHVLAAYNVYVTAPLLRLTEHSTSLNTFVAHAVPLIEYMEDVKENPLTFFTGHPPFGDVEESEAVTKRSMAHIEYLDQTALSDPEMMVDIIEELSDATITYFKKKYQDFLPGGKNYNIDSDVRTVPVQNKGCEHNFGILDWDIKHAPNKRSVVRAIRIQATINKTYEWFEKLDPEEQAKLLNDALQNASKLEQHAAIQEEALRNARWDRLLQKQREDEIKNAINARKQAEANIQVQNYGGCWNTVEQMERYLDQQQSESQKRKAVEAQLKCHKLSPTTEKKDLKLCVLTMSNENKKRVPKTLASLKQNLTALIVAKNAYNEESEDEIME